MFKFSEEQEDIANQLSKTNVIVDAVAGSGKTTTIKRVLELYDDVLILLYNKRLCEETKEDLPKASIFTIHGSASRYYGTICNNDETLHRLVLSNPKMRLKSPKMIIVDEAQDLTPVLQSYLKKLVSDCSNPKLLIMGDHLQCVYKFKDSNSKYLTNAQEYFPSTYDWKEMTLSTTYRCSSEMVEFVNRGFLGYDRMKAVHSKEKVLYLTFNTFDSNLFRRLHKIISSHLSNRDYGKFAVLCRTFKGRSPCVNFAEYLTAQGIPIYIPSSDSELESKEEVSMNKVLFSTIPGFKGRERDVIIFFGMDSSFYDFKGQKHDKCKDDLYVALTRAKEKLIVVHHNSSPYVDCFDKKKVLGVTEFIGDLRDSKKDKKVSGPRDVTMVIKFKPFTLHLWLMERITIKTKGKTDLLKMEHLTRQEALDHVLYEDSISIYGSMITLLYALSKDMDCSYLSGLASYYNNLQNKKIYPKLETRFFIYKNKLTQYDFLDIKHGMPLQELAFTVVTYEASRSGYSNILAQINNYDFVLSEKDNLDLCVERLTEYLKDKDIIRAEYPLGYKDKLVGRVDFISEKALYEIKMTDEIKNEHIYQITLYAVMKYLKDKIEMKYYIFNAKDNTETEIIFKNIERDSEAIINHFLAETDS